MPGDPVRVGFTKWGGSQHWTSSPTWLGEDEFGWWLGDPAGTAWVRGDGRTFSTPTRDVLLVPRGRGHTVMFYEQHPTLDYRLYVDITSVPMWTPDGGLTAHDLDLDVVEHWDGRVEVLDEDEFAEHRVRYGYPAEVAEQALAECVRVADELAAGAAHFSPRLADGWRAQFIDLLGA